MSVKYPVYSLVLLMNDLTVETGIRVHDFRSLAMVSALYRSRSFGKLGRSRFALHLQSAGDWEDMPLSMEAIPSRSGPSDDHARLIGIYVVKQSSGKSFNGYDGEAESLDVVK